MAKIFKKHKSHVAAKRRRPFGKLCKFSKKEEYEWLKKTENRRLK